MTLRTANRQTPVAQLGTLRARRPRTSQDRLALLVLVAAAEPRPGLIPSLRRPVEPLVHAPEGVHTAGVGGVGVVDDAVSERERAHPRCLTCIGRRVSSDHGGEIGDRTLAGFRLYVH